MNSALWIQITLVVCYLPFGIYSGRFDTSERDAFIELPCSELCGYHRLLKLIFKPVSVPLEDQRSAASCERNTKATLLLIELVFYTFYNPGQKSLGQYSNIHIFLSFLGSLSKTVHHFRNVFAVLPPPPYTKLKLAKNSGYTRPTLFVGWGQGLWICMNWKTPSKRKSVPRLLSMIVAVNSC